jgi:hypothetical protein
VVNGSCRGALYRLQDGADVRRDQQCLHRGSGANSEFPIGYSVIWGLSITHKYCGMRCGLK